MKLHLRADSATRVHTAFTIFMNGANCGQLIMKEDEALFFHDLILGSSHLTRNDEIYSSGYWFKGDSE